MRAAACFHRDSSEHEFIKNEIVDKEDELDIVEAEEREEFLSGIKNEENYYDQGDDVYYRGGLRGDY